MISPDPICFRSLVRFVGFTRSRSFYRVFLSFSSSFFSPLWDSSGGRTSFNDPPSLPELFRATCRRGLLRFLALPCGVGPSAGDPDCTDATTPNGCFFRGFWTIDKRLWDFFPHFFLSPRVEGSMVPSLPMGFLMCCFPGPRLPEFHASPPVGNFTRVALYCIVSLCLPLKRSEFCAHGPVLCALPQARPSAFAQSFSSGPFPFGLWFSFSHWSEMFPLLILVSFFDVPLISLF